MDVSICKDKCNMTRASLTDTNIFVLSINEICSPYLCLPTMLGIDLIKTQSDSFTIEISCPPYFRKFVHPPFRRLLAFRVLLPYDFPRKRSHCTVDI